MLRPQKQCRAGGKQDGCDNGIDNSRPAPAAVPYDDFVKHVNNPQEDQSTTRHSVNSHLLLPLIFARKAFELDAQTSVMFRRPSTLIAISFSFCSNANLCCRKRRRIFRFAKPHHYGIDARLFEECNPRAKGSFTAPLNHSSCAVQVNKVIREAR